MTMKADLSKYSSKIRELVREIYFARMEDLDDKDERIEKAENELLFISDWMLELSESLMEVSDD